MAVLALLHHPVTSSAPGRLVRHPNTIAYPEKFFESAQAIAAHSHLLDWESRLPCVLGPRKSRLPLFTRKQQRLLTKPEKWTGFRT
ncbi:hypothetical protein Bca52824_076476 [Brassica carinata]|uniref:Uncharacterized protein n=1 Tax=Brassica carinata TaxID=52824 RepID=A0A8X7PU25_BRACI|nr:hypothetical protein Bca52824_076476 [Brassica carinata]